VFPAPLGCFEPLGVPGAGVPMAGEPPPDGHPSRGAEPLGRGGRWLQWPRPPRSQGSVGEGRSSLGAGGTARHTSLVKAISGSPRSLKPATSSLGIYFLLVSLT